MATQARPEATHSPRDSGGATQSEHDSDGNSVNAHGERTKESLLPWPSRVHDASLASHSDAAPDSPHHGVDPAPRDERSFLSQSSTLHKSGCADASTQDGLPRIAVTDYADRQRLLYHITYLSTQLQRAQLQLQEQQRTILLLRAAARQALDPDSTDASSQETVQIRIAAHATTAALLAADEERELHETLQANLALFDPMLAQTQIHRLDNALAKLGLLREAELQRLRSAEDELGPLRQTLRQTQDELAAARAQCASLQTLSTQQHTALAAAEVEVGRLRAEEVRLNRRLTERDALERDGAPPIHVTAAPSATSAALRRCEQAEQVARQTLLQTLFWEPMLIAFDAALTWLSDTAAARASSTTTQQQRDTSTSADVARVLVRGETDPAHEHTDAEEVCHALRAPVTDVDLLLLQHQQEELTQVRGQLHALQERLHHSQLAETRLRQLYEAEQRRSETLAQTHAAQLQRAYDQVQKDGEVILRTLRTQVAEQVARAYHDGQQAERRRMRQSTRTDIPSTHTGRRRVWGSSSEGSSVEQEQRSVKAVAPVGRGDRRQSGTRRVV